MKRIDVNYLFCCFLNIRIEIKVMASYVLFLLGPSTWPVGCLVSPSTSSSSLSFSVWCLITTSALPVARSCQKSMTLGMLWAGQIWQGEYCQKGNLGTHSIHSARCASAALATLLPTLLLRTRKVLKDPSPGEHSDLLPKDQEHAYSSASEQRKEPCDNSTSEDLREEDTFRVPGVVDGKSWTESVTLLFF